MPNNKSIVTLMEISTRLSMDKILSYIPTEPNGHVN